MALFNLSNKYLNLVPVLNSVIQSAGAAGRHQIYYPSPAEAAAGASQSEWMLVAARDSDFAFLAPEKRWRGLSPAQDGAPLTGRFFQYIPRYPLVTRTCERSRDTGSIKTSLYRPNAAL